MQLSWLRGVAVIWYWASVLRPVNSYIRNDVSCRLGIAGQITGGFAMHNSKINFHFVMRICIHTSREKCEAGLLRLQMRLQLSRPSSFKTISSPFRILPRRYNAPCKTITMENAAKIVACSDSIDISLYDLVHVCVGVYLGTAGTECMSSQGMQRCTSATR